MAKRKPFLREHRRADGAVRYTARVRIKGFAPEAKTFTDKSAAHDWIKAREVELERQRSDLRSDVTTVTLARLIKEYLAEPRTRAQRSFSDTARRLAWFV